MCLVRSHHDFCSRLEDFTLFILATSVKPQLLSGLVILNKREHQVVSSWPSSIPPELFPFQQKQRFPLAPDESLLPTSENIT